MVSVEAIEDEIRDIARQAEIVKTVLTEDSGGVADDELMAVVVRAGGARRSAMTQTTSAITRDFIVYLIVEPAFRGRELEAISRAKSILEILPAHFRSNPIRLAGVAGADPMTDDGAAIQPYGKQEYAVIEYTLAVTYYG